MSVTSEITGSLTRSGANSELWENAYEEARRRGAGHNIARLYAHEKIAYSRRSRDGSAPVGARDYQSYR